MCRCSTRFRREGLELEKLPDGEQAYLVLQDVSSCGDLQETLPGLLLAMIGMYGVISLVCVAAGVISLLVYQTERRRKYLEDTEEDTYSTPPSPSSSGNYAEHHTMLPAHSSSTNSGTTLVNIYTNPNTTTTEEDIINEDGNTTPSDLIYSPADVPMGYAEACSMRRCQSFSQPLSPALREGSPGSSTSSQTASLLSGERIIAAAGARRLQEHRKKGRRAVTLHGLDREQLLLILSLQMRYLQESDQSSNAREVANNKDISNNNNSNLYNNRALCRSGGVFNSGSGAENRRESGPSGGSELENRRENGLTGGSGHYNADSSWLPSDQQRRAITPTPRQERLSSSRTTDDDLDYRPAKLARSHTPQPYHFKNSGHYSQSLIGQSPSQPLHFSYHQQKQPQQLLHVAHCNGEDEPPTLITYDLRNITKTGPIVYENVPTSSSSFTYSSNSSPMPQTASNSKQMQQLPPGGHQKQSSLGHQSDPADQVLILGGNIHSAGKSKNQLSRQTSQASTSSQMSLECSPSDTRRLVPAKEKSPEPIQAKAKGKKKLTKKDKNSKKEEELTSCQSGLSRTDSSCSRGGVADRWQTLTENGPKQVQTLWENVQRKIVSDPQTPDSTLDIRPLPLLEHQLQGANTDNNLIMPSATPRHGSFQALNGQKLQQQSAVQVVSNGILKNSLVNYSSGTPVAIEPQNLHAPASQASHYIHPLSSNQATHYSKSNQFSQQLSPHYPNAFVPLATSSVGTYEDIDDVFPTGQQLSLVSISNPYPTAPHAIPAPVKPPRVFEVTKFGTGPSLARSENSSHNLRPKSYMTAVDRETTVKNNFVNSTHSSQRSIAQDMELGQPMGHHVMTHLLMEGPVMDTCHKTDGSHFQIADDHVYSQPQRKPNVNYESPQAQYIPGTHIYQNAFCQQPDISGQFSNMKRRHLHGDQPQWPTSHIHQVAGDQSQWPTSHIHQVAGDQSQWPTSNALQVAGPSLYEDISTGSHEICDTDLDDLPRPHRQLTRGQMYSSPQQMTFPAGHHFDRSLILTSNRSLSSSSCEPQNTSCTSSERSTTPSMDLQQSFPGHNGVSGQHDMRGHPIIQTTDHIDMNYHPTTHMIDHTDMRGHPTTHIMDHTDMRGHPTTHMIDHTDMRGHPTTHIMDQADRVHPTTHIMDHADMRGHPISHVTDRRFCVTHQQIKSHQL